MVPLLAYALFGPSRILVLGPDSALAAVILAVVLPHSGGDPTRAAALAGMMAVVSGVVCILAGLFRFGFITELLSKPIRYGYMNGIALTVLINQLPKVFGVSIERDGPLRNLWRIAQAVLDGRANAAILAVGAGTLVVILVLKCFKRVPGILIAVVAATIAVGAQRPAARLRRQSVPPRNRVLGPTVLRLLHPRGWLLVFQGTQRLRRLTPAKEAARFGCSRRWCADAKESAKRSIYSRSNDAVTRVCDEAGNVIETHENAGDFKEPSSRSISQARTGIATLLTLAASIRRKNCTGSLQATCHVQSAPDLRATVGNRDDYGLDPRLDQSSNELSKLPRQPGWRASVEAF
jgi:hypothetical protein